MSPLSLNNALRLPALDVEALIKGRSIAAMVGRSLDPGEEFALYPGNTSINSLPNEQQYHSSFLSSVQNAFTQLNFDTVSIRAWARCELCQMIEDPELLKDLSRLTIWTIKGLEQTLLLRPYIFLAHLRVYLLPQPLEMLANSQRQFVFLPNSLSVTDSSPVLSDRIFTQRRHQLENLLSPLHPELEELQGAIAQLAIANPIANQLDQDIKILLGWTEDATVAKLHPDLEWIKTIANVGNSSDGNLFEKLVRRGLLKLGFAGFGIDPDSTGGAGGMDFYCETPYPVVGECKATKTEKVSDGTPAQLLKIGMNHLGTIQYNQAIKLIVAAGDLNFYATRTATENKMNVIRPETLEKLVEMQVRHKNSINLLELKKCLQQAPFGLADDKVNSYIDRVNRDIKLRSHIVQLVKNFLQNTGLEQASVESLYGAYFGSNPPQPLKPEELHEILIELSSPLTGYLGRTKGNDGSDRFYFLRELLVDA